MGSLGVGSSAPHINIYIYIWRVLNIYNIYIYIDRQRVQMSTENTVRSIGQYLVHGLFSPKWLYFRFFFISSPLEGAIGNCKEPRCKNHRGINNSLGGVKVDKVAKKAGFEVEKARLGGARVEKRVKKKQKTVKKL